MGRRLLARASVPARRLAARRALRTAAVTFAAFAIGRWGVGSVAVAVFATFTGLAITGIADFGGSLSGRLAAATTTVAIGMGLTALGTWMSTRGVWADCAVIFAIVVVISFVGLLGGYAAAAANALILFYVVAAGSAAPSFAIPDRLEGVALGGALAVAASVLLWPEPAKSQALRQLGSALRSLAARLGAVADGEIAGSAAGTPSSSIRQEVDALVDRPAAPTESQRAELYLMNDVERLERLTARLERTAALPEAELAVTKVCAATLSRSAEALSGETHLTSAAQPERRAITTPFSVTGRLAAVAAAANRHADLALGRARSGEIVDAFRGARHGSWAAVRHGAGRFRANLRRGSVYVHDALRLGAGLALASAAVEAFDLQHGFWVAFAALTVIKSNLRATSRSVGEAIIGTLLGFLIADAIIAGLEPGMPWYLALLPIAVAAAIYANVAVSFLAGQAGFTLVIIVLFNLLGPAGWRIGVVRVADVAAGALAGLCIAALAWPRGASASMAGALADLLDRASSHLAGVARGFVGRPPPDGGIGRRQRAADAAVRADNTFTAYLSEHPPPQEVARWAHWLSTGNRLWYAADLIAAAHSRDTEPAAETVDAADRLAARYTALAASLRGQKTPPLPADRSNARHGSADLPAWLDDLADETRVANP